MKTPKKQLLCNYNRKALLVLLAAVGLVAAACAPKIYVLDRQTVLEETAAGSWPEFDRELAAQDAMRGPTPLQTAPLSAKKDRLYRVLNGDMTDKTK